MARIGVARAAWLGRACLLLAVALAAAAGLAAGAAAPGAAAADLARLLRGMALIKLALVAAAVLVVDWRVRQPIGRRLAGGYGAAVVLMAAAPGLIWELSHVIAAALLFHAGLGLLLVLGWRDGMPVPSRASRRTGIVPSPQQTGFPVRRA